MEIRLRPPKAGDEPELARLCGEMGYPSTAEQVAARLTALSDRDDHLVLVAATAQDRPAAWVHAHLSFRVVADAFAELGGLVVGETHRSQKVGERLLLAAEDWWRSQGATVFRVRSNALRERAHRFYLRAGYQQLKTSFVFEKTLT